MPILPLASISSLLPTIVVFQRRYSHAHTLRQAQVNPAKELLPYCSAKPPIPEATRNLLRDTFHSISSLALAATTSDGLNGLKLLLAEQGPDLAEDIIDFWKNEYTMD